MGRSLSWLALVLLLPACDWLLEESPVDDADAGFGSVLDAGDARPVTCGETLEVTGGEGAGCDDVVEVTLPCAGPVTLEGSTTGTSDRVAGAGGTPWASSMRGPDRSYRVGVPAGRTLHATVQAAAMSYRPSIVLVEDGGCGTSVTRVLRWNDLGAGEAARRVAWTNAGAATHVLVVIDSAFADDDGPFKLELALDDARPGDRCDDAIELTPGTPRTGERFDGAADDYADTNWCENGLEDRVYVLGVPAGRRLVVSVDPAADVDVVLGIVSGEPVSCDGPRRCLQSRDLGFEGQDETVTWTNDGDGPARVFAIVERAEGSSSGAFGITATLLDPQADAIGGEGCSDPTRLSPPVRVEDHLAGATDDIHPETACTGARTIGGERTYVVTVPNGRTLVATLTPSSSLDAGVYLLRPCAQVPVCLDGDDAGEAGEVDEARWSNTTGAAVEVVVVVDTFALVSGTLEYALDLALQ